jgi:stage V sporulation protein AC
MAGDQGKKATPGYLRSEDEIKRRHQEILTLESKAAGAAERERLRKQRLALEQELADSRKKIQKAYAETIKDMPQAVPWFKNMLTAFAVGGLICTFAQGLSMWFSGRGLEEKMINAAVSSVLIVITGILTAIGVFDDIGKRAGAGTIVPVTGFANSIVAAALEFKKDGFIYGVGGRMFTVAGPVIVYGTLVSAVIGLVCFFMGAG